MKTLIAALLVTASVSAQEPAKPPAARPSDVASIDAIIAAVYDVISGPAGQKRDWDRMRSLFVPGARLIPASPTPEGGTAARVLDVEGYIQRAGPALERGFFESEISRKADVFDNIAQVFSTYESRHAKNDAQPFASGHQQLPAHEGRRPLVGRDDLLGGRAARPPRFRLSTCRGSRPAVTSWRTPQRTRVARWSRTKRKRSSAS